MKGTDSKGRKFVERGCNDELTNNECRAGDYVSNYGAGSNKSGSKNQEIDAEMFCCTDNKCNRSGAVTGAVLLVMASVLSAFMA